METKRNLKYFIAPPISIPLIVGVVVLILSGLCFILPGNLTLPGIFGAILGVGIMVFATSGKSNDTDIGYQTAMKIKDLDEKSMKKFEVYERSFLKIIKPVTLKGHEFNGDADLLVRKGSDGVTRTTLYNGCVLFFTNEKIYIYKKHFSLVDDLIDEDIASYHPYPTLDCCGIDEKPFTYTRGKNTYNVTYYEFWMKDRDGNDVLRMDIEYGADSDKAVEDINHVIKVRTKAIEERRLALEAEKAARKAAAEAQANNN